MSATENCPAIEASGDLKYNGTTAAFVRYNFPLIYFIFSSIAQGETGRVIFSHKDPVDFFTPSLSLYTKL